ncbi:MAG: hypothetical protein JKY51_06180 [Opitutaceae bacterium]|nr:hypothetical protein [Opitutaceae bacterium]
MIERNLDASLKHLREEELPHSISSLEANVWRKIRLQKNGQSGLDWIGSLLLRSGFIMSTFALTILLGVFFGSFSSSVSAQNKTSNAAQILGFDSLMTTPSLTSFTNPSASKKK